MKESGFQREHFFAAHLRRMIRFGAVGASGVAVNFGVLYLLAEKGGVSPLLAVAVATEVSILTNFLLNDSWTFRDARGTRTWLGRAVRYNVVALTGLVVSVAVFAELSYGLGLYYLYANLFAICAGTLFNYAGSACFAWTASGSTESFGERISGVIRRGATIIASGASKLWM